MKQLKLGDIMDLVQFLKDKGMNTGEIYKMPVYLGDDEELNGIHMAFFVQPIDSDNAEDDDYIELINELPANIALEGKGVLIS